MWTHSACSENKTINKKQSKNTDIIIILSYLIKRSQNIFIYILSVPVHFELTI